MSSRKGKKDKENKTLAMKVLEGREIPFEVFTYPETIHDAVAVAGFLDVPSESVFKSLVILKEDTKAKPLIIMLPGSESLDLKKTAHAFGIKKIHMAKHDEAEKLTGLKVGGISPLALLNRGFDIFIDEMCILFDEIYLSAGQRGMNLKVSVSGLIEVTDAKIIDSVSQS